MSKLSTKHEYKLAKVKTCEENQRKQHGQNPRQDTTFWYMGKHENSLVWLEDLGWRGGTVDEEQ